MDWNSFGNKKRQETDSPFPGEPGDDSFLFFGGRLMGFTLRVVWLVVVSFPLVTAVIGNRIWDRDSPGNVLSARTTGLLANNLFLIPLTEDVLFNLNRMLLSIDVVPSVSLRNGFLPGGFFSRRG